MVTRKFSRIDTDNGIEINIDSKHEYRHYVRKYKLYLSNKGKDVLKKVLQYARELEKFRLSVKDNRTRSFNTEIEIVTNFNYAYEDLVLDLFGTSENISFADYSIYIEYNQTTKDYDIFLITDYNAQITALYIEPKIKSFPGFIRGNN